jgi:hypothetical protein
VNIGWGEKNGDQSNVLSHLQSYAEAAIKPPHAAGHIATLNSMDGDEIPRPPPSPRRRGDRPRDQAGSVITLDYARAERASVSDRPPPPGAPTPARARCRDAGALDRAEDLREVGERPVDGDLAGAGADERAAEVGGNSRPVGSPLDLIKSPARSSGGKASGGGRDARRRRATVAAVPAAKAKKSPAQAAGVVAETAGCSGSRPGRASDSTHGR